MPKLSKIAQQSILTAVTIAIIAVTIVHTALNPAPKEQFFDIYLLGSEGKTGEYFPNDNSNVSIGQSITWRLGVKNAMDQAEYISLRIKLGNGSLAYPNRTSCTPSSYPTLLEYRQILTKNNTYEQEFTWSITNITKNGQSYVLDLLIDGILIKSPVQAIEGLNFRLICELWVLDSVSREFDFGWTARSETSCIWTQLWFNATTT